jgi:hypothetical protein
MDKINEIGLPPTSNHVQGQHACHQAKEIAGYLRRIRQYGKNYRY